MSLLISVVEGRVIAWKNPIGKMKRKLPLLTSKCVASCCLAAKIHPDFPWLLGTTSCSRIKAFSYDTVTFSSPTVSFPGPCFSFHIPMWSLTGHTKKAETGNVSFFNNIEVNISHYVISFHMKQKSVTQRRGLLPEIGHGTLS